MTNTQQTFYFYKGSKISSIKQGEYTHTVLSTQDNALAECRAQARTPSLLANDQQGSVINVTTDSTNVPRLYTPYGHDSMENQDHSLLGYNGEHHDGSGLYLLGHGYRGYNPVLMRFVSPDSLSPFDAGGLNPYAYCINNPILNTDPTGHMLYRPIKNYAIRNFVSSLGVSTNKKLLRYTDIRGKRTAVPAPALTASQRADIEALAKDTIAQRDLHGRMFNKRSFELKALQTQRQPMMSAIARDENEQARLANVKADTSNGRRERGRKVELSNRISENRMNLMPDKDKIARLEFEIGQFNRGYKILDEDLTRLQAILRAI